MPRVKSGIAIKIQDTSSEALRHPIAPGGNVRTSLLLLHGQFLPVGLHAVPKRHPQIGLLLRGHVFPSLLDVGERRVGDGVCLAGLLKLASYRGSSGEGCACRGRRNDGSRAPRSAGDGRAQHGGGWSGEYRKIEKEGGSFPSRDLQLPMDRGGDGVEGGPGELSCKMWLREERQGGGTIISMWPERHGPANEALGVILHHDVFWLRDMVAEGLGARLRSVVRKNVNGAHDTVPRAVVVLAGQLAAWGRHN